MFTSPRSSSSALCPSSCNPREKRRDGGRMGDVSVASPSMRYSDRNLFTPWSLAAVRCISHCISIEAPSLTAAVISPFCTLGILQRSFPSFPISSPSAFYLHIYSRHIYLHMLLAWADKREQCAHVEVSRCTLAFYELMAICSIRSPFTGLSCKLLLFSVQTHAHTQTNTPLWWQPCSF